MLSVFERCELALGYANSQERGRVLARLPLDELTDSELRGLLALWWPACDAVGRGDAVAIYRMFERVGHVVDSRGDWFLNVLAYCVWRGVTQSLIVGDGDGSTV